MAQTTTDGPDERVATGGSLASRRRRFREWRGERPFGGGVLLMLAGLLIAWVPAQFAAELMLVGGAFTYIGLLWALLVFATGAFALRLPQFSTELGVLGVAFSILSLLGALGGLLIGMTLGIIGGNLCLAWKPDEEAAEPEEPSDSAETTDRDQRGLLGGLLRHVR